MLAEVLALAVGAARNTDCRITDWWGLRIVGGLAIRADCRIANYSGGRQSLQLSSLGVSSKQKGPFFELVEHFF